MERKFKILAQAKTIILSRPAQEATGATHMARHDACRKRDKAAKTPRGELLPPTLLLVAQIL